MIQLTAEKIQIAISKARAVKPGVCVNRFGSYTVTNKETGATYTVTCERRQGRKLAHCTCRAGQLDCPCYHVAAAVGAHIQLATERAGMNS